MPRALRLLDFCAMFEDVILHSRPYISEADIKAVTNALKSGQLSQGPRVKEFEKKFEDFVGKKRAAAVNSGSAALHLALLALDIREKDEVIIPSFVCSAVLNAVKLAGATPVIVDIEPLTFNISAAAARGAITQRSKAIIVPHMFGCPAELAELCSLGIPVIEDCAQASGASFQGRPVGSFGLLSVFSFYATKVLTAGEGGMVLTDSDELISKIKDLRDYDNRDSYLLRFNYKMTDIQASLGVNQLAFLENFIAKRREIASCYFEEFKHCDFSLPIRKEGKEHIYYRFVVKTKNKSSPYLEKLQQKKVMCQRPVYIPLHLYFNLPGFPNTMEAWEKTVSIPIYPSLREEEIERIIAVVKEIF